MNNWLKKYFEEKNYIEGTSLYYDSIIDFKPNLITIAYYLKLPNSYHTGCFSSFFTKLLLEYDFNMKIQNETEINKIPQFILNVKKNNKNKFSLRTYGWTWYFVEN